MPSLATQGMSLSKWLAACAVLAAAQAVTVSPVVFSGTANPRLELTDEQPLDLIRFAAVTC